MLNLFCINCTDWVKTFIKFTKSDFLYMHSPSCQSRKHEVRVVCDCDKKLLKKYDFIELIRASVEISRKIVTAQVFSYSDLANPGICSGLFVQQIDRLCYEFSDVLTSVQRIGTRFSRECPDRC